MRDLWEKELIRLNMETCFAVNIKSTKNDCNRLSFKIPYF